MLSPSGINISQTCAWQRERADLVTSKQRNRARIQRYGKMTMQGPWTACMVEQLDRAAARERLVTIVTQRLPMRATPPGIDTSRELHLMRAQLKTLMRATTQESDHLLERLLMRATTEESMRAQRKRAQRKRAQRKRAQRKSAQLKRAQSKRAQLKRAPCKRAQCKRAQRKSAQLKSAHLKSSQRKSAQLKSAQLKSAQLKSAPLKTAQESAAHDSAVESKLENTILMTIAIMERFSSKGYFSYWSLIRPLSLLHATGFSLTTMQHAI
jgi:hypothetical protein